MRIVRALATFAAQPRGTRRLLSVRFASDFVSMSARPGAVADAEVLADLKDPLVIDVRDPSEVASGKGGPPGKIDGSINVPLNIDGVKQSERPTTQDEFLDNIKGDRRAAQGPPDHHALRLGRPRRQGGRAPLRRGLRSLQRRRPGAHRGGARVRDDGVGGTSSVHAADAVRRRRRDCDKSRRVRAGGGRASVTQTPRRLLAIRSSSKKS